MAIAMAVAVAVAVAVEVVVEAVVEAEAAVTGEQWCRPRISRHVRPAGRRPGYVTTDTPLITASRRRHLHHRKNADTIRHPAEVRALPPPLPTGEEWAGCHGRGGTRSTRPVRGPRAPVIRGVRVCSLGPHVPVPQDLHYCICNSSVSEPQTSATGSELQSLKLSLTWISVPSILASGVRTLR